MTKGIVICTSEYTKDFLKPLLESIKDTKYDILVVSNGGYLPPELAPWWTGMCQKWHDDGTRQRFTLIVNEWNGWEIGGIQRGKETFDEFVFLMDTCIIKDITLFDKLFAIEGNVVLTKGNYHYMGKFVTKELPNLPRVHDKTTAIMLEVKWLDGYKYTEFQPDLPVFSTNFEEVHGQNRMVLTNEYMTKWKGTYWVTPEQKEELDRAILNKSL